MARNTPESLMKSPREKQDTDLETRLLRRTFKTLDSAF